MNGTIIELSLIAVLVACGIYLLLERALTRILLGILLLSNGLNILLLIVSGKSSNPSFYGSFDINTTVDPLVQALCLTSIVISMGSGAFILALAYRSFMSTASDEITSSAEDLTALIDEEHPGAAAELIESEDHHSYISDPRIDRAYADTMDNPTGDLFEPLTFDDDMNADSNTRDKNTSMGGSTRTIKSHKRHKK